MLRIAICDDEIAARDMLRIQLEKVLVESTEEIVYEFSSGVNAVSWLQKHPGEIDLLFLDVEMDGLNGMETAKKIRAFDKDLSLVFVTGYADYVFDGSHACALDYLLKPVSEQKLRELLHRVREKQAEEETETFFIKNMDGTWRFRLRDILYFYSDRRRVILVTRNGQYPFYAKLDDIESRLSSESTSGIWSIPPMWITSAKTLSHPAASTSPAANATRKPPDTISPGLCYLIDRTGDDMT